MSAQSPEIELRDNSPKNTGIYPLSPERHEEILRRLRRIEGQIRGVQRMVESGRDCRDIVYQIVAIRQALASTGSIVLECYAQQCLSNTDRCRTETIHELIDLFKDVS
ncbi:metal-sensitive transcriptional regulator [Chloroflexus sp.]|uniref:metal-sensitive transcriptional regulator n=1 Tax=Chloroflexus sp. TaxID=1904827 RepID=UPI003D0FFA4A